MSVERTTLLAFSGALMVVAAASVGVGSTPYLGFFRRNFIARRKWEPAFYWIGVAQYVAGGVILGLLGLFAP